MKHPYGIPPFKSPESWAKKSKVSVLTIGNDDEKEVVGYKVENDKETFTIPVFQPNNPLRKVFEQDANVHRGSRYFKPSYSVLGYSYNVSRKSK